MARRVELGDWDAFVLSAREGSFADAARELGLTAAAVAKRVTGLENALGVKLLERGSRGVQLSSDGRELYAGAVALLDQARSLVEPATDPLRISGVREVTGRRSAPSTEAVLSETERILAQIFHSSPAGIVISSADGSRIHDVNDAYCNLTGYSREELLSRDFSVTELWDEPRERDGLLDRLGESTESQSEMSLTIRRKDGQSRFVAVVVQHVDVGGSPRLFATVRDVTERTMAERRSAHRSAQQQVLADAGLKALTATSIEETMDALLTLIAGEFTASTAVLARHDLDDSRLVAVAAAPDRPLGSPEVGVDVLEILERGSPVVIDNLRADRRFRHDPLARGRRSAAVAIVRGSPRPWGLLIAYSPEPAAFDQADLYFLRSAANLLAGVIQRERDQAYLKETERSMADAYAPLDNLQEQLPIGLGFVDPDLRYRRVNPALAAMVGLDVDEIVGRTVAEISPASWPAWEAQYDRVLRDRTPIVNVPAERETPDGGIVHRLVSLYPVDSGGTFLGIGLAVVDVTARFELERRVQHGQRLEAVGQLAAGVAHDFNNLLMAVLGHARALQRGADADNGNRAYAIAEIAVRAGEVAQQLVTFAGQNSGRPRAVAIDGELSATVRMLEASLGERIELTLALDGEPVVMIDRGRLQQILINLCVNARDAMPDGGRLELVSSTVDVGERGSWQLEVIDSGAGMSQATMSRIFDPFFTTKSAGSGMGLSTVYGIVRDAGGEIAVSSTVGVGTTFTVRLPLAEREDVSSVATSAASPPHLSADIRGARILLVEDDEIIREMLGQALIDAGLEVVAAADGFEALERASSGSEIDLVVTDTVMPGPSGPELVARLRVRRPDLPAIVMSGYGVDEGSEEERFLLKPFSPDELIAQIDAALTDAGSFSQRG
jgi:PAS domain S-box-containing protein